MHKKYIKRKSLKYTTLNRYLKKRKFKKKVTSLLKNTASFNYKLSFSTFSKEKKVQVMVLNSKMLKALVFSEPLSFRLLSLTFL